MGIESRRRGGHWGGRSAKPEAAGDVEGRRLVFARSAWLRGGAERQVEG
jgi:hypothetical protein